MRTIGPRTSSRWRAQLGALGMDAAAAREPAAQDEARRIAAVRLPALVLPGDAVRVGAASAGAASAGAASASRRYRAVPWLAAAAAAAAFALAFAIFDRAPRDPLHVKGATQIHLWSERNGAVTPFTPDKPLTSGDRVMAEIEPSSTGFAYWLVVDSSNTLLVDPSFLSTSRLAVHPGTRATFADGLRLVGPAAGETLVVLVCKGAALDASKLALIAPARGKPYDATAARELCDEQRFKLR